MSKTEKAKGHIALISKVLNFNRILSYFAFAIALILSVGTPFILAVPNTESILLDFTLTILATSIPILFLGYAYYVVSDSLCKVINNVEKGQPFDRQNQKEVRKIGIVILALSIFLAVFRYIIVPLATSVTLEPDYIALQLNPILLAAFALIVFALAEVFAQGEKLKEDQDLTV